MEVETNDRDYDLYTDLMSKDPVVDQKFNDIQDFIRPGMILDDGCGDGALLGRIAELYPDTMMIGADLSEKMIERTEERARIEGFDDSLITTHQFDITETISRLGLASTIISSSTGHEIWSYGDRADALDNYLWIKKHELEEGGRLIIRDVIGPRKPERDVGMWLDPEDGQDSEGLEAMSTRERFHRFEEDFSGRPYRGAKYRTEHEGRELLVMEAKDAAEYLLTKDYTGNWESEIRESFAHWSQDDYEEALEKVGLDVIHTETYTNQWIEENRFQGKAELYEIEEDGIVEASYPPTNIVIVGEN